MNDITSRNDIATLVNAFYEKVRCNAIIGHYFKEVIDVDWEKHLPVMYDFWEGVVFGSSAYTGNPINAHKKIHALNAFTKSDFEEWLRLFHETTDELFAGEKSALIKQRATSIATVMQLKIIHNNQFYG